MKQTKIISLILSAILAVGTFTASMPVSAATTTSSVTASTKTPSKSKLKISAMSKAKKTISLSWTKSTNAKEYIILSSINGEAYTTIDTTTKLKYTYIVPEDGVYKFKIKAVNGTKTRTSNPVKKTVVWYSDGADFLNKGTFILDGDKMKLAKTTFRDLYNKGYRYNLYSSKGYNIEQKQEPFDFNSSDGNIIAREKNPKDHKTALEIIAVFLKGKTDILISELCYQCRYYNFETEQFELVENAPQIFFAEGINYNTTQEQAIKKLGKPTTLFYKNSDINGIKEHWEGKRLIPSQYYSDKTVTCIWEKGDNEVRMLFTSTGLLAEISFATVIPTPRYESSGGAGDYGQNLANYKPHLRGYGLLEEETTD